GLLVSRRFCELCETQNKIYDWLPRLLVGIGLFFGIIGLGFYWQKPEKPLNVATQQIVSNKTQSNKNPANQNDSLQLSESGNVQDLEKTQQNTSANQLLAKAQAVALKQKAQQQAQTKPIENQPSSMQKPTYFCGAQTKKGTPCSRRVKGGGRCFQHVGQPAILPPEKLIASQ
ncbi:MAG: hypothetical protein LC768_11515, partial [Acidobacteria bacterium]|nr:hypothetical protein [Acidobacteriota bacterium]